MASDYVLNFFFLNGDLNRDRTVSIADFITLSSNFGKTNATYADGDLNYDGQVTIADFIDLASNFNKTLDPPTPSAPAFAAAVEINSAASAPTSDLLIENPHAKALHAKPILLLPRNARHHRKPSKNRQH
jgi:hypothetical protein